MKARLIICSSCDRALNISDRYGHRERGLGFESQLRQFTTCK